MFFFATSNGAENGSGHCTLTGYLILSIMTVMRRLGLGRGVDFAYPGDLGSRLSCTPWDHVPGAFSRPSRREGFGFVLSRSSSTIPILFFFFLTLSFYTPEGSAMSGLVSGLFIALGERRSRAAKSTTRRETRQSLFSRVLDERMKSLGFLDWLGRMEGGDIVEKCASCLGLLGVSTGYSTTLGCGVYITVLLPATVLVGELRARRLE